MLVSLDAPIIVVRPIDKAGSSSDKFRSSIKLFRYTHPRLPFPLLNPIPTRRADDFDSQPHK